jgi:thiamine kinase-like enzyme
MVEGVNSNMIYLIYYKNFCKCCNVPQLSTTVKQIKNQGGTERHKTTLRSPSHLPSKREALSSNPSTTKKERKKRKQVTKLKHKLKKTVKNKHVSEPPLKSSGTVLNCLT